MDAFTREMSLENFSAVVTVLLFDRPCDSSGFEVVVGSGDVASLVVVVRSDAMVMSSVVVSSKAIDWRIKREKTKKVEKVFIFV